MMLAPHVVECATRDPIGFEDYYRSLTLPHLSAGLGGTGQQAKLWLISEAIQDSDAAWFSAQSAVASLTQVAQPRSIEWLLLRDSRPLLLSDARLLSASDLLSFGGECLDAQSSTVFRGQPTFGCGLGEHARSSSTVTAPHRQQRCGSSRGSGGCGCASNFLVFCAFVVMGQQSFSTQGKGRGGAGRGSLWVNQEGGRSPPPSSWG